MRSLTFKLTLSFVFVSLVGIALIAILAGRITQTEFGNFIYEQNRDAILTRLTDYYSTEGSWENVLSIFGPHGRGNDASNADDLNPQGLALADANGVILIQNAEYRRGQQLSSRDLEKGTSITVDGQQVGTMFLPLVPQGMLRGGPANQQPLLPASAVDTTARFIGTVNRSLFIGAVVAIVISVLLGIFITRTLTRPLKELTRATKAVAAGDLEHQVPIRSKDEIGQLAESFNQMNADLRRSRDLRRQMTADIAHELRTPLSIILGHAEALSDGVLPATQNTFNIIYEETERLNGLVGDLRTLSLSEAGELSLARKAVAPAELLERVQSTYMPQAQRKQVRLETHAAPDLPRINIDPDRMMQVLNNLVSNALRYVPEGSGFIRMLADDNGSGALRLIVQDNGKGIPAEDLPGVFERFYRADKARNRHDGGSGLGLAIARSIVEKHDGRIWVESQVNQGTQFTIELPLG